MKNAEYLVRNLFVTLHARPDADGVGAQAQSRAHRHGGVHAKLANLVAGGRYDSAARGSANDERLPRQRGIVAHFDGCVEGIHIDMQNRADHRN